MKKRILYFLLFIALIAGGLFYLARYQMMRASLEVLKVHDCGHVDIKLTNLGTPVYYSGYDKASPIIFLDTKVDEKWILGRGPWCGTGLKNFVLKRGESVEFFGNRYKSQNPWRYGMNLYQKDNKSEWLRKVLHYMRIDSENSSLRLNTKKISEVVNTNNKCEHIKESEEIEKPPELGSGL